MFMAIDAMIQEIILKSILRRILSIMSQHLVLFKNKEEAVNHFIKNTLMILLVLTLMEIQSLQDN